MIETTIPGIDVAELMQRVRAEAAKIAQRTGGPRDGNGAAGPSLLPAVRVLPPPPAPVSIRPVNFKRERLEDLLKSAREDSAAPKWVPKPLRGLFRDQGGFNRRVLDMITSLVKTNSELTNRARELSSAVEAQSRWLNVLADRRAADGAWMRAAEQRLGAAGATPAENDRTQEHLTALQGQLDRLGQHVVNLQGDVNALGSSVGPEQLRGVERQVEQIGQQVNQVQLDIAKNNADTRFAQRMLEQMTSKRSDLEQQLMRLEQREAEDAAFIKAIVAEHSALLQRFIGNEAELQR